MLPSAEFNRRGTMKKLEADAEVLSGRSCVKCDVAVAVQGDEISRKSYKDRRVLPLQNKARCNMSLQVTAPIETDAIGGRRAGLSKVATPEYYMTE